MQTRLDKVCETQVPEVEQQRFTVSQDNFAGPPALFVEHNARRAGAQEDYLQGDIGITDGFGAR